ncbi:MAG: phospholipid carrier-dependent glycosyltransferase [Solirubrobacterales bacterium]
MGAGRLGEAIRTAWPPGAPGWVLLGLLVAGVALRVLATVSWWPVTTTLDDGYELFASSPFDNQLHPGGYSLILGAIGLVTHEVVVPVFLQHLSGIASALLLWAATRRVSGSEWAGLVPVAVVLLDPDFIFLEHSIMSESWLVLWISFGLYATVRAFDQPEPWWRWPLLAGVGLALAVTIRTAPLFMIPVAGIALLLWRPRSFERWGGYWRAALAWSRPRPSFCSYSRRPTPPLASGSGLALPLAGTCTRAPRSSPIAAASLLRPAPRRCARTAHRASGPAPATTSPTRARRGPATSAPSASTMTCSASGPDGPSSPNQATIWTTSGSTFAATGFRARGPTGPTPAGSSIHSCPSPMASATPGTTPRARYPPSSWPSSAAWRRSTTASPCTSTDRRSSFCAVGNAWCGSARRHCRSPRFSPCWGSPSEHAARGSGCCCSASGAWC